MTSSLNLFWTAISQNAPQRSLAYGIVATWQGLYLENDWDLSGQFFPVGMGWHCLSGCWPVKRMIKHEFCGISQAVCPAMRYTRNCQCFTKTSPNDGWLVWEISHLHAGEKLSKICGILSVLFTSQISCTRVPVLSFAGFRRENN